MTKVNLFEEMMSLDVATVTTSATGKYSLGLVNSESNGKRFTLSKSLAQELGIDKEVFLMPHPEARIIVISKEKIFPNSSKGTLSGKDKKTCYSAGIVKLLTDYFKIDFSEHVSRTFTDIDIDIYNDNKVAVITVPVEEKSDITDASVKEEEIA